MNQTPYHARQRRRDKNAAWAVNAQERLKAFESFDRYWFALCADGQLVRLGDFGDYEAADECAEAMGLEVVWLVCGNDAAQWADTINSVRN